VSSPALVADPSPENWRTSLAHWRSYVQHWTGSDAAEELRASRRFVPGVIAAGLAVLLVIGFLNYHYRSARSERAGEYYKTGSELVQQGRYEEAVQQFRDALSATPGNAQYRLSLGLALAKANHPAEASVYLDALLKRDPQNGLSAEAYAELGNTEVALQNYSVARAAFQKALQLNPSDQASQKQLDRLSKRF
jgi:tetratricopeptide (TPR) repeat protein